MLMLDYGPCRMRGTCNVINQRLREEEILDESYAVEIAEMMFDKTYSRLMNISKTALFIYYYDSFRILNLSFNFYSHIMHHRDDGNHITDGRIKTNLITDSLLEDMTRQFKKAINDIVCINF